MRKQGLTQAERVRERRRVCPCFVTQAERVRERRRVCPCFRPSVLDFPLLISRFRFSIVHFPFSIFLGLVLVLGFAPGGAFASDKEDVRAMMERTVDKTIEILTAPELKGEAKQEERRAKVRETLLGVTDARRVSLLVLGRHRTKFTGAQITAFTEAFAQLVFLTYISHLEAYTDQTVEILSVEMLPKSKAYAATKIISKGKETPADFSLFKNENGKWKVYDVKVEGVSMVSNYRSQFSELLLKQTPDELIAHLQEKVKENEEGG